jgi:hypothetical protein
MEIKLHGAIALPTRHLLKEQLIKNGARNQSKMEGYQMNGEEYKHLQRIAKHFVKERLINYQRRWRLRITLPNMPIFPNPGTIWKTRRIAYEIPIG